MGSRRPQSTIRSLLALALSTLLLTQVVGRTTSQTTFDVSSLDTPYKDVLEAAHKASLLKTCGSCQALLLPLKRLAALGDRAFVSSMVRICKARKLQDPDICEGDIGSQGPIISHALRSISTSGRTSRLLCNALFGMCDIEPAEPWEVPMPELEAKQGIETIAAVPRDGQREPFQVVHLSDLHVDPEYAIGSEANCTKYICCRTFSDQKNDNIETPAKPFGNRRCDTPVRLAESMLSAIHELVPEPKFTISTGDVVDHANWLLTRDIVENELHAFHEQLYAHLSSSNHFYGSLGNHDVYPTNEFPRSTSDDPKAADWVYSLIGADWKRWIGDHASQHIRHGSGSYAVVHPGTKLKLISINSLYWHKFNFWLYDSDNFQPDPNGILLWLVEELHAAEKAGQKAWIFAHIPPGSPDIMNDQSNYYNQVVQRFKHVIAGQFYGHTHHDEFQVAYTNYSEQTSENAMSFGLVAPSLTPTNGNPAFTVYDVNPDTYEIMDVKVYISDMQDDRYHTKPKWRLYYSARDTYGASVAQAFPSDPRARGTSSTSPAFPANKPLDAVFWHQLTEIFLKDNATFVDYLSRRTRGARPVRRWSEEFRNQTICDLRAMRSEDSCFHQSLNDIIIPPPHKQGESEIEVGEEAQWEMDAHRACEGSALPIIMRRLVRETDDDSPILDEPSPRQR